MSKRSGASRALSDYGWSAPARVGGGSGEQDSEVARAGGEALLERLRGEKK